MATYASNEPATSAPEHAIAFAASLAPLPTKEREARKDHDFVYPAGIYVDESTDAAAQAAFEILSLVPRVTKKEAQFALNFHLPHDVTRAANRWAKAHEGAVDHRVNRPAPFRPVVTEAVQARLDAEAAAAAQVEAAKAEKAAARKAARASKKAAKSAPEQELANAG